MALASGTNLGPCETQALLGAGGMGEVYRARDTRLGREVAIKILAQHLSAQPELKERFDREARAISSLNHPRICALYDIGHQNGVDFLVMEYLDGESLAVRLQKGPLPLKETLKIGMEVCEALEVAHRAGITHRDLKPANIMLTRSGAKLMDFGLAKSAAGADGGKPNALLLSSAKTVDAGSPLSPLTTAGAVLGTIQYMSPEQIEGQPADQRSDLFALGAVLYEMATGKRPFDGKSQISVANAILEKTPEPISVTQPVTPPAFERVVSTCLEKNPDDRFQSARDVRLELSWVSDTAAQLAPHDVVPATQKFRNILGWRVALIFALVAAGLFFLGNRAKLQPRFTNVTFREGALQAARFSHDGQTIVYSGEWENQPPQVAVARVGSPESRSLDIPWATIASVSASDVLAVLLGCEQVFLIDCKGTLATMSLAGGAPRSLAEHVAYADWDPDGKQLAISVFSSEGARLEFPPGHVLFQQNAGWFGHPRFSPDGSRIAFENHPISGNDEGALETVDLSGKRTVLVPDDVSLEGIAWSPDGKEVWYAGTSNGGWADTIYAVSLSGRKRTVLTMPYVRLHDIAKDGRVLLSHESWRRQLKGFFPGDKTERPYSWLDDTEATGISDDGRWISFAEGGETYYLENDYMAYYRATNGSPAVLLGAGTAAISPDGKWLLSTNSKSHKLQLQPLGPGQPRELPTPGLKNFDHQGWSGDGRQIVYEAQTDQNDWNVYQQRIDGGPPALVKAGARNVSPHLSHDGELLALREEQGGISLYRAGNPHPVSMKGVLESEYPVLFLTDGRSLLVGATSGNELELTLVDLTSGHRESWKSFPIDVQTGGEQFAFTATPDLKYYTYSSPRYTSDLFIVENLH